jgi:hypothetical protein
MTTLVVADHPLNPAPKRNRNDSNSVHHSYRLVDLVAIVGRTSGTRRTKVVAELVRVRSSVHQRPNSHEFSYDLKSPRRIRRTAQVIERS